MKVPSVHWSPEFRRLLFVGVAVLTAVAVSYEYVTTAGVADAFFGIVAAGSLLAALVVVPVLLVDRRRGPD